MRRRLPSGKPHKKNEFFLANHKLIKIYFRLQTNTKHVTHKKGGLFSGRTNPLKNFLFITENDNLKQNNGIRGVSDP